MTVPSERRLILLASMPICSLMMDLSFFLDFSDGLTARNGRVSLATGQRLMLDVQNEGRR
jgi:hypothetical protein